VSPRAWLSWSSGKDAAAALAATRAAGALEVTGLLTTVDGATARVPVHGVPLSLVRAQARALSLPQRVVELPWPCPNEVYEERVGAALVEAAHSGVGHLVFGDLHLAEIRAYRERMLAGSTISPLFPLWGRPTDRLARESLRAGVRAVVTCVDTRQAPAELAGRWFDERFLDGLPSGIDPCGENGEFHTFVVDGPGFAAPVDVGLGPVVERDGFALVELAPN
jgi:diphthamide synthase (EF-2-diphthine--ammonia ligase)